jgi:predicted methyltransferase
MRALVVTLALVLAPAAFAQDLRPLYEAALASPHRSDKDRERDARDKPVEVLEVAGIHPGMRIADVFGAGGYWSEILAGVVGPKGSVLLVNNPPYVGFAKADLEARFADGTLTTIHRVVVDPADMKLGSGELDAVFIVMSYHDLYNVDEKEGWPAIDAAKFLDQIHASLKPGGEFVIIDHAAAKGTGKAPAQTLHRIDEDFAKKDIASHGFTLVKTWDGLRNPADEHTKQVFDPAIRGKTDRFVHVYRR